MNISSRLVELRKNLGITQAQLSARINYSDKVISKWERGESVPDIGALVALCEVFGLTLDEFVKGAEELKQEPPPTETPAHADRLKKYRVHFLLGHILLLLGVFTFWLAQFAVFNFFRGYGYWIYNPATKVSTIHLVHPMTVFALVFTGLIFAASVADMILTHLKKSRIISLFVIFSLLVAAIVLLWVEYFSFGVNAGEGFDLFKLYIVAECALTIVSLIYGIFLQEKVFAVGHNEDRYAISRGFKTSPNDEGRVVSKKSKYSVLAILGLVFAFAFPPAGLVLGLLGEKECKNKGLNGGGIAKAGWIISIVGCVFIAAFFIGWLVVLVEVMDGAKGVADLFGGNAR
jgi:transcriptional regulator with XRE-family HTH domain